MHEVVKVVNDQDLSIVFDDGVKHEILEGMVPPQFEKNGGRYTSDLMFIMESDEDGTYKLVDWICGITTMTIEDIVEYCTNLRNKGADEAFRIFIRKGME